MVVGMAWLGGAHVGVAQSKATQQGRGDRTKLVATGAPSGATNAPGSVVPSVTPRVARPDPGTVVQAPDALAGAAMRLLHNNCLSCHGAEKRKGGLSLETREAALKGGENGRVLVPGSPDESVLIRDRKSTRLNSSHIPLSRMPSSA